MKNISKTIAIFNDKQVHREWDKKKELWYFSIIDIISILTNSSIPKRYWSDLKRTLKAEGSEVYEKIVRLKMVAPDGKRYLSDAGDTETIFRIIQTIPSPNAEPFKLWLAKVGYERVEETQDPELAFERAMRVYLAKGYSKEWINQRLKSIEVRKELTDEWQSRGIKAGKDFAILTDEITKAWADRTVREYKDLKGIKKGNLRDNMTNIELVLNMLAEASTTEISKIRRPTTFPQNIKTARDGGTVAKRAREEIEKNTGKSIIAESPAKELPHP